MARRIQIQMSRTEYFMLVHFSLFRPSSFAVYFKIYLLGKIYGDVFWNEIPSPYSARMYINLEQCRALFRRLLARQAKMNNKQFYNLQAIIRS